jgi:hypothetical protein
VRLQTIEHDVRASSAERRNVLNQDPIGPHVSDEPSHFSPEAGAGSVDSFAVAGKTDVLAREASGDKVDSSALSLNRSSVEPAHVREDRDAGKIRAQPEAAVGIHFAEADRLHAGPFEA